MCILYHLFIYFVNYQLSAPSEQSEWWGYYSNCLSVCLCVLSEPVSQIVGALNAN